MRKAFAILFLGVVIAGKAFADPEAVREVIRDQISAFKVDDVTRAFRHASPTIRDIFRTPERFGEMVRRGYPMVWRPADVRFLSAETRNGRLYQSVLIRDLQGVLHILEYEMIEGASGWKINGVRLRMPSGAV